VLAGNPVPAGQIFSVAVACWVHDRTVVRL